MKSNWVLKKLGEIIKLEYGKPLDKSKRKVKGKYPVYGANGEKARSNEYYHDRKSIIVGRKGSAGEINITEEKFWPLDVTYFVTFDDIKFDFRFLYYLLGKLELQKLAKGVKPGINRNDVYAIDIMHPPLPEQKRIVKILDKAFAAIDKAKENAEKNLANFKELFDSYLNNIFTNPGEDWEEKKLGEVCETITKGSSPKWQGIKYVYKPGVMFITSENVGQNKMIYDKIKFVEEEFNRKDSKSILKIGDVLTNIVGASIGRTAIFDRNVVANINQAVCILRCNQKLVLNKYLTFLLNSPYLVIHLHDNEINNARANLSLTFFRELYIPVPKIPKQKHIVSEIECISMKTKRLEEIYKQKLADLEELKKSVLQKTFKGKF